MKNQALYKDYAISGLPNHFFTIMAAEKYNKWIEKQCEHLPDGTRSLPLFSKVRRVFIIQILNFCDTIWYHKEQKERDRG